MAQRDPRAAEAARLRAAAAGEQKARAQGGVVLGSGAAGMPSESELLQLAAARMGDMQAEIDGLREMGGTMAGIVSALAEIVVTALPTFERRDDGSFDVRIDQARMQSVRGYEVTYALVPDDEGGGVRLQFVPPAPPETPSEPPTDGHAVGQATWPEGKEPPALALVEDPPIG